MPSTVAKPQPTADLGVGDRPEDYEGEEGEGGVVVPGGVTSQVCIRPGNGVAGTLDKEVVLRQIRQRKRMNKVRGAVQGWFGLPRPNKEKSNGKPKSDGRSVCVKWVDDPFTAP